MCCVIKAEFCCSEKKTLNRVTETEITERKALTSVLNKPFFDPKTKVITSINKPFVEALSEQENSPACKHHTDTQVQGYQPM